MTDPERAAFVEWFIMACDGNPDYPANQKVAELAARAVERAASVAYQQGLAAERGDALEIPWRAAMVGAECERTGPEVLAPDEAAYSASAPIAAARLDAGRAFIRFLLTGAEDPGADESVVTVTTGLLERYLTDDAALARIVAPKEEPAPERWTCESCGKDFYRETFSHVASDADGNPVACGPVSRRR